LNNGRLQHRSEGLTRQLQWTASASQQQPTAEWTVSRLPRCM